MNLVSCPRCGAQFDVSSFAPGSKFVCGACQNLLQVPAAPAVAPVVRPVAPVAQPAPAASAPRAPVVRAGPASAPPAPAASEPSAAPAAIAKKPAVDRRRAADAAPSSQAAPEGRAERLRRQRAEAGVAPKKNPLPLLLGAVAGVALVGGGIFWAMGRGGGEGPATAPADGGGSAAAAGAGATKAPEEPEEVPFEKMEGAKRIAFLEQKRKEALRSAEATREVVEWMRSKGLAEDAKGVLEAGHRTFAGDEWINGEMGLVNRAADVKQAAENETILFAVQEQNPDLKFVIGLHERIRKDKSAGWISAEESKRLDEALEALKNEVARAEDPVYQRTKQEWNNVRLNPVFNDLEFAFNGDFRPYVIFAENPGTDEARKEKARQIVKDTGEVLSAVYGEWLSFMKEELELDAPRLEDLKDERFKVFIFKTQESFNEWHTRNKIGHPGPSVAAYYQHGRDRMIIMHLDAFDRHIIRHEATHQIIHFYARHFTQADDDRAAKAAGKPSVRVEFEDHRLDSAFFWFQEGIAEYFGGGPMDLDNAVGCKAGGFIPDRVAFFAVEKGKNGLWPVEDFLFADQSAITARAQVKGGGAGLGDWLKGLMYAQGWTLCHYLLHGDGGKWRPAFLKTMKNELTGYTGKTYLLTSFGLPKRSDDPKVKAFLQEIQAGYVKYFTEHIMGQRKMVLR
jgi:hypothetical protein